MEIKQCILTKNDCYKANRKMTPKGIVVHSTGANNPTLKRYLAPDDGIIGKNLYNNDWNRSGLDVCVHAFIGKDKNGEVRVYQTLPFNICCWGVGKGSKGSYNYNPAYIQFEICEDGLTNDAYFNKAFGLAIEFCKYLCDKYNIPTKNIVSHYEAHQKGYGSNHGDPHNWLKKHNKTMDWFREQVGNKNQESTSTTRKLVAELQEVLNKQYGCGLAVDNSFGPKTAEACSKHNLSKGVKAPIHIKWLQTRLKELGYSVGSSGVDGSFGNDTLSAVKKFQKDKGLKVDGYVGKDTHRQLTK